MTRVRCSNYKTCDDTTCTHYRPHYPDANDPSVAAQVGDKPITDLADLVTEECTNPGHCFFKEISVACIQHDQDLVA